MPLAWTEIRQRAITFSRNWADASRERAEAQTFWNEFFDVFGVLRRTVATFEEPVKNFKGDCKFIDLFWAGRLIAEHKSRGKDLSRAASQANGYCINLANENRQDEMPQFVIVSDFARIALHDLECPRPEESSIEFPLADLHRHIRRFAFIAGYQTRQIDPEDPANLKATQLLANLHDRLEDVGYTGHDLQRFMVRILFCLFADDTGIFEPESFKLFIRNHTREDGSDLGPQLQFIFRILDTPPENRPKNLDEDLAIFPYVNGELFRESLSFPVFDTPMRNALMACCQFEWARISPAVFGSLFQGVMDARERRQIGAHYTSERDILKLIRSLFMDDLRERFESAKHNRKRLEDLHDDVARLRLLDPACGCGNFLVLAYRELRRLEMDILHARFGDSPNMGDILSQMRLHVGQFHGIEIEEWPVRIAEVAMWLMDHQMNQEFFHRFGGLRASIPLKSTPHIRQANALRIDWNEILSAGECAYVLGNPPFVGKQFMAAGQKQDMDQVFAGVKGAGVLDFVTAWYVLAAQYMRASPAIRAAFVSTSSITQGEQAGVLWSCLFSKYGIKIHFAHRTFPWASEARGKAHVHVVIIGFSAGDFSGKRIYDYDVESGDANVFPARNISPYLVEGGDLAIVARSKPLCDVPEIVFGSMPNDGGHLLLDDEERAELLAEEPDAAKWLRRFVGSHEFINGQSRWCLWLGDANPAELRRMPAIMRRIDAVRAHRQASPRATTRALALTPSLFGENRQPSVRYLLIPSVSSESRRYIPMGFIRPDVIASNLALMVPGAGLYHLGILSSAMHIAWVRQVCGRLESRYRYSNKLVYNNFPWPQQPTESRKAKVERCAQRVLDVRVECGDGRVGFLPASRPRAETCTLADLYDPLAMPGALARAHADLDRAVDASYRSAPFTSERQRVEFLFALYEQLTAPLAAGKKQPRRKTGGSGSDFSASLRVLGGEPEQS